MLRFLLIKKNYLKNIKVLNKGQSFTKTAIFSFGTKKFKLLFKYINSI